MKAKYARKYSFGRRLREGFLQAWGAFRLSGLAGHTGLFALVIYQFFEILQNGACHF